MTGLSLAFENWVSWAVWGLISSAGMATLLEGAQLGGLSRMSLPFLFGTFAVVDRRRAIILGYFLYLAGGWVFALLYAVVLGEFYPAGLWTFTSVGLLLGLGHGAFLITVFLPLLPLVHPRLANGYDGPEALAKIEPPGLFGLNYGRATPVTTVAAQVFFGLIMGLGYGLALAGGAE